MTKKFENPPIAPILEHYGGRVPTRRGWVKMHCPFHDDSHASASVSLDENVFCCFACQIKGNGYKLLMLREGVEFREALKIAQGIFDTRGEVLSLGNNRGGGVFKSARNKSGSGSYSTVGRRLRPSNGS